MISQPKLRRTIPLVFACLVFFPSLCFACLNDTEVKRAEDQFHSQYESTAPRQPAVPALYDRWGFVSLALGSGMVVGTLVFAALKKWDTK